MLTSESRSSGQLVSTVCGWQGRTGDRCVPGPAWDACQSVLGTQQHGEAHSALRPGSRPDTPSRVPPQGPLLLAARVFTPWPEGVHIPVC